MAALPQFLAEEELRRASSSSIRSANLSHGRGGAGNIGTSPHDSEPLTLNTPTLKGEIYTTGRGGSGNMTKNTDPEHKMSLGRSNHKTQSQLESQAMPNSNPKSSSNPRRESPSSSSHVGRGGAANVFNPSEADIAAARKDGKWDDAVSDEDEPDYSKHDSSKHETEKGLADKGKAWLKERMGKA
ncbi:hypothetical protein SBOR_1350 [Sclerotinia borealis F-4128]|uniref:Uncharacterized protein n=1 Tax=Sclerotinia borealis (strain F-4128) TaxID=1432307 RepID=W9CUI8_SCLBF|nr:hypothetical protein SBOR_1350 [Sclerotinia borealis F-4128]